MAKLAAGVRKKENGRYEKRFTVDGKRYSVSGSTSKECVEKELALRKELEEGTYKYNNYITVDQYYEEWTKQRTNKVKSVTALNTDSRYRNHIKPYFGKMKIKDIEKRQVKQWLDKLCEINSPSSCNLILTTFRSLLNDAVEDEIIDKNPVEKVKPVSVSGQSKAIDTIHRALTMQEQEAFIKEAESEWLYEFMYFSLCTGMRIMEVAALTWGDIDQDKNVIHITKTYSIHGEITTPKTEKSIRDIPITSVIQNILNRQKMKIFSVFGGKYISNNKEIFIGVRGNSVAPNTVTMAIKRTIKRVNEKGEIHIERFTHHAFRDTFATRFIEGGGNMQTLKTILGHSSLKMTADLYSHVLPNTKQKEMELVESLFG